MSHWTDKFKDFEIKNGMYYAGGNCGNPVDIDVTDIIEILRNIAHDDNNNNNEIRVLHIYYGRIITGGIGCRSLDIEFVRELNHFEKDATIYIQLPSVKLLFHNTVFTVPVSFDRAQFQDYISFKGSRFEQGVSFSESCFKGRTDFLNVCFKKGVNFNGAQFEKITLFSRASFLETIDFGLAHFKFPATFANIKYWPDSVTATLKRCLCKTPILNKLFRRIWLDKYLEGKPPKFVDLKNRFERSFKREGTQFLLDSQNIGEVSNPHFKRYVADQQYLLSFQARHRYIHWFWRWSSDCGRSIGLWAFWSLIIAVIFGLVYHFAFNDYFIFTNELLGQKPHWYDFMYYSVVTFTTLGFGDIVPSQPLARGVVGLEVVFGYVMLGGLISIFANKLARRS